MEKLISDVAFTSSVKARQMRHGSRDAYARRLEKRDWLHSVTPDLAAFLAERDSFYFATASADGQPYIQHRGGPRGLLRVLDERRLAFADFSGNRQYITLGNLDENAQAHIFLMDYALRRRVKIWGTARVVEDDPDLLARLADPAYPAEPERAVVFDIAAWDINCPKHITRRYDEASIEKVVEHLKAQIAELESALADR